MMGSTRSSILPNLNPRWHFLKRDLIGTIVGIITIALSLLAIGGESVLEIDVDGVRRSAVVFVPDHASITDPLPLLLVFHGSAWNGRVMQTTTGFSNLAEEEGFIAVYPNGSGPSDILSWNARYCCSFALERDVDDLAFIDQLLDVLLSSYPVDPAHVYATGFSNGGMLSYILALERPDRFAAVAVVSGSMVASQQQTGIPVPILIIHGTSDSIIPYSGGWGTLRTLSGKTEPSIPAEDAAGFWITNNSCTPSKVVTLRERTARIQTYVDCNDQVSVVFITLLEGGHDWPTVQRNESDFLLTEDAADLFSVISNDVLSLDVLEVGLDASQTIWDFFKQY